MKPKYPPPPEYVSVQLRSDLAAFLRAEAEKTGEPLSDVLERLLSQAPRPDDIVAEIVRTETGADVRAVGEELAVVPFLQWVLDQQPLIERFNRLVARDWVVNPRMTGKKHSPETRARIGASVRKAALIRRLGEADAKLAIRNTKTIETNLARYGVAHPSQEGGSQ